MGSIPKDHTIGLAFIFKSVRCQGRVSLSLSLSLTLKHSGIKLRIPHCSHFSAAVNSSENTFDSSV